MVRQLHVTAILHKVVWADCKNSMVIGEKKDVTENFLGCVLQFFDDKHKLIRDADGNEWEVTITQTKKVD
jgi:hypothetical protein